MNSPAHPQNEGNADADSELISTHPLAPRPTRSDSSSSSSSGSEGSNPSRASSSGNGSRSGCNDSSGGPCRGRRDTGIHVERSDAADERAEEGNRAGEGSQNTSGGVQLGNESSSSASAVYHGRVVAAAAANRTSSSSSPPSSPLAKKGNSSSDGAGEGNSSSSVPLTVGRVASSPQGHDSSSPSPSPSAPVKARPATTTAAPIIVATTQTTTGGGPAIDSGAPLSSREDASGNDRKRKGKSTADTSASGAGGGGPSSGGPAPSAPPPPPPVMQQILMEFGDEYFGEVVRTEDGFVMPDGHGTLQSQEGKHCYVGDFTKRWRDGFGKLVTERYVMWARWKMNRPDLSTTVRIDYTNGDKYSGFLALVQDIGFAQQIAKTLHSRLSKFSIWVQSCSPTRERWGELVSASGDRYFGQWENDLQSGFGCYVGVNGDRYIGLFRDGFFHDTGTLFSTSYRSRQHADDTSLLCGTNLVSASGTRFTSLMSDAVPRTRVEAQTSALHGSRSASAARDGIANPFWPPEMEQELFHLPEPGESIEWGTTASRGWKGVVFDGVWERGRFCADGHVTFPCGTRITASWKNVSHAQSGVVVPPAMRNRGGGRRGDGRGGAGAAGQPHMWRECFHWEPLLGGGNEEAKKGEFASASTYRNALLSAGSNKGAVEAVLKDFLTHHGAVVNATKIFRRCFYFLHGTCGSSAEIGAGLGANRLGWCYLRSAFGGCIHRGHGRPISSNDLELALIDIYSYVRTVLRWTYEMMGDASDVIEDLDCEPFICRGVLDVVLTDVHDVLLNLYAQVFRNNEAAVAGAVERLRGVITLDDLGVNFARRHTEERLFNPYADAVHRVEQVSQQRHSLTAKLEALQQWSHEIDLATRMAQLSMDDRHVSQLSQQYRGDGRERAATSTVSSTLMAMEAGSADDLLPIHQYVLTQATVPHLFATSQLLADFCCDDTFVDTIAQESFCITTLQACVTMLPQLHPLLRDECRVLIPASVVEERMRHAVATLDTIITAALKEKSEDGGGDVNAKAQREFFGRCGYDLVSIVRGYLRRWLPDCVGQLACETSETLSSTLAAAAAAKQSPQCGIGEESLLETPIHEDHRPPILAFESEAEDEQKPTNELVAELETQHTNTSPTNDHPNCGGQKEERIKSRIVNPHSRMFIVPMDVLLSEERMESTVFLGVVPEDGALQQHVLLACLVGAWSVMSACGIQLLLKIPSTDEKERKEDVQYVQLPQPTQTPHDTTSSASPTETSLQRGTEMIRQFLTSYSAAMKASMATDSTPTCPIAVGLLNARLPSLFTQLACALHMCL